MLIRSRIQILLQGLLFVSSVMTTGCETDTAFRALSADSSAQVKLAQPSGGGVTIPAPASDAKSPTDTRPDPGPAPSPKLPPIVVVSTPSPSVPLPPEAPCLINGDALVSLGDDHSKADNIKLAGKANVEGDVTITGSGKFEIKGNSSFSGKVYAEHADAMDIDGKARKVEVIVEPLADIKKAMVDMSKELAALAPTQAALDPDEKGNLIVLGNGGMNVIPVNESLHVAGKRSLTLKGSASDVFIFNVKAGIHFAGHAKMELEGGVLAKNVVFNLISISKGKLEKEESEEREGQDVNNEIAEKSEKSEKNGKIKLSGKAELLGIFLSIASDISMTGHSSLNGALISGESITVTGKAKVIAAGAGLCSLPKAPAVAVIPIQPSR